MTASRFNSTKKVRAHFGSCRSAGAWDRKQATAINMSRRWRFGRNRVAVGNIEYAPREAIHRNLGLKQYAESL